MYGHKQSQFHHKIHTYIHMYRYGFNSELTSYLKVCVKSSIFGCAEFCLSLQRSILYSVFCHFSIKFMFMILICLNLLYNGIQHSLTFTASVMLLDVLKLDFFVD
jgi:hypothetical protein